MGYVKGSKSFAIESNLVSNYSYEIIKDLSAKGYFTELIYIGVDKLDTLNERILERTDLGEHYISPADVAQRYKEALSKLPVNLKYFDEAVFADNSQPGGNIREILQLQNGIIVARSQSMPTWINGILPIIERLSHAYESATKRTIDNRPRLGI